MTSRVGFATRLHSRLRQPPIAHHPNRRSGFAAGHGDSCVCFAPLTNRVARADGLHYDAERAGRGGVTQHQQRDGAADGAHRRQLLQQGEGLHAERRGGAGGVRGGRPLLPAGEGVRPVLWSLLSPLTRQPQRCWRPSAWATPPSPRPRSSLCPVSTLRCSDD